MPIHPQWVTTGLEFDGQRIVGYRGVVRGITVRSRNVIVNLGAFVQTLFGGNTIVAMRYDANDVAAGMTEVLCYGTAVVIGPAGR